MFPHNEPSEAQRIENSADAYRGGDFEAGESFCELTRQMALRIALLKFRFPRPAAEDVAQEMAIRALVQLRRGRVTAAWIRRGTQFLCIDTIRAARARARGDAELPRRQCLASEAPRIEANIDVLRALSTLPRHCYDLVRGRFWDDLTWAQLDDRIGGRRSQYELGKCLDLLYAAMARNDRN